MTVITKNPYSIAVILAVTLSGLPTRLMSQEREPGEPAPLKGGFVHQLRSLTQEAIGAFKPRRSGQTSRPADARQQQRGNKLPPQPTGRHVLQRTHRSPWLERSSNSPADSTNTSPDNTPQPLAAVVTPEEILSRVSAQRSDADTERDPKYGLVHVEQEIPDHVRASISPNKPQPLDSQLSGEPTTTSDSEDPRSDEPQVPKVSRIPLPQRRGAPTSSRQQPEPSTPTSNIKLPSDPAPISARQQAADPPTLEQPSESPAATSPRRITSMPLPTLPRSVSENSSSSHANGVSVPAKLVDVPTSERRKPAPPLPQIQKPSELPPTPAPLSQSPTVANETPNVPTPRIATNKIVSPSSPSSAYPPASPTLPRRVAAPSTRITSSARSSDGIRNQPSQQYSHNSIRNPASGDQRMKMQTPRIEVLLNGPADLPVGSPTKYDIVVRNSDQIDLRGLILRLDIPSGVNVQSLDPSRGSLDSEIAADGTTLITWSFEHLEGGGSALAPLQLQTNSPKNFAVAMEWTLIPVSAETDIHVLAPRIELALEGPSEVVFGQPNVYRLHVRNPGNATASDVEVTLSAEPYGASSSVIGDIAAGQEEVIDVELTFNQRGAINIAAMANAYGGLESDTAIEVLVQKSELEAAVSAPELVYHGSETNYLVHVANRGDADARDVKATIDIPANAKVVSMPTDARQLGNQVSWPIKHIPAGDTQQYAVQLNLQQEGENSVQLMLEDSLGSVASSHARTMVQAIADLKLSVSDPIAPAPVGAEVLYELTLTNRGSKAAQNVAVIAQFSEGIEPTRAEGHEFRIIPGQLLFEPISTVEAGQSISLQVFAEATGGGMHRFRAEVRTDANDVRLVQEESTQFMNNVRRVASPIGNNVIR